MKQKLFTNIKRLTSIFSIAILIITIIILLLRLTIFSNPEAIKQPNNPLTAVNVVDGDDEEILVEKLEFNYNISDKIVFKDSESTANPKIQNDSKNKALMQVKIIRNDNKNMLYESGYIQAGINESAIKLSGEPLEAGTYECTAEVIVLDKDTMKVIDVLTKPIVVEVEKNIETKETETPSDDKDVTA